jgi:membrane protein CcdC involved in cytochrome C biogenesis
MATFITPEIAKSIGRTLALKAVSVGLIIAYILITLMVSGPEANMLSGLFWIFSTDSRGLEITVTVATAFYSCAYYFGGWAGRAILAQNQSYLRVGALCGLFTLLAASFISILIIYGRIAIADRYVGNMHTSFMGFISWPLFYISKFGILPSLFIGLWFGWSLHGKAEALK